VGLGVRCTVGGRRVLLGNRDWAAENGIMVTPALDHCMAGLEASGRTAVLCCVDGVASGVVGVADSIKDEARPVLRALQDLGVRVGMLTGDNERTALAVAREVGIDVALVQAGVLPKHKADAVRAWQEDGHRVAMVGDGINDAPALAQADVGLAIGSGTEVALEAADIVLVRNALVDVLTAVLLSHAVLSRIRLNFVWAMGYNLVGIPLAAGVFYPAFMVRLPPMFAGLAMAASSVSVVCSSLLLKRFERSIRRMRATLAAERRGDAAFGAPPGHVKGTFTRSRSREGGGGGDDARASLAGKLRGAAKFRWRDKSGVCSGQDAEWDGVQLLKLRSDARPGHTSRTHVPGSPRLLSRGVGRIFHATTPCQLRRSAVVGMSVCLALTIAVIIISVSIFQQPMCCRALTAQCIACTQGTTVDRVCAATDSHLAGCAP